MKVSVNMHNSTNPLIMLSNLKSGSKIKLTSGEIGQFIRLKRKNFEMIMDGKQYNVPIQLFDKVIEEVKDKIINLKKGELFCILYKGDSCIYKFDSVIGNKIIGINPITNVTTKIDKSLYECKVSEL